MISVNQTLNGVIQNCHEVSLFAEGQDKLANVIKCAMDSIGEALRYLGHEGSSLMGRVSNCSEYMSELQGAVNFFNLTHDLHDYRAGTYFSESKDQVRNAIDNIYKVSISILNCSGISEALRSRDIVGVSNLLKPIYERIVEYAEPLFLSIDFVRNSYMLQQKDENSSALTFLNSGMKVGSIAVDRFNLAPNYILAGVNLTSAALDYYLYNKERAESEV